MHGLAKLPGSTRAGISKQGGIILHASVQPRLLFLVVGFAIGALKRFPAGEPITAALRSRAQSDSGIMHHNI